MYQKIKIVLFPIFIIVFGAFSLKAQFFVNQYHKIGTKDGLSQNIINTFFQDSRGFMWIGTNEGLNFYDGYQFTVYKNDSDNPHSLRNNAILGVTEDSEGLIWILTTKGIERFDPKTEKFRYFPTRNEGKYEFLNFIKEDNKTLWIGTDKGLLTFDIETKQYDYFEKYESKGKKYDLVNIIYFQISRNGGVWMANYGGDIYYKEPNSRLIYKRWTTKLKEGASIMGIWLDESNHNLWFTFGLDNLHVLNLRTNKVKKIKREIKNIREQLLSPHGVLLEDKQGMVWTVCKQGLIKYNPKTFRIEQEFVLTEIKNPKTAVYSLFLDKNGLLWIGTNGEGILQIPTWNANQVQVFQPNDKLKNSLSYNSVRAIYEDQEGRVWIGGYGPLEIFEKNGHKITPYDPNIERHPYFQIIYCITEDAKEPERYIWIGFEGYGFLKFDKKTLKTVKHYLPKPISDTDSKGIPYIYDIVSTKAGILWLATKAGLLKFDTRTEEYKLYQAIKYNHNPTVKYIISDKNKNLWLGTASNGLVFFDTKKETFTSYIPNRKKRQGLIYPINCVFQDDKENFWLASAGDGLYYFDKKKKSFEVFKQKEGLPSEIVYGILSDKNQNLWLSTLKGIAKFNTEDYSVETFGIENGLQDEEFNTASFFQSKNGKMFFGGINGLNAFYPQKFDKNSNKVRIILREVQLASGILDLPKPLEKNTYMALSYRDARFVQLTFTSQNYYKTSKSQYAYRIKENHKDWIVLGNQNQLTLSNLAPGTYTVEIVGTNNDGVWNYNNKMILEIEVETVYWYTWWFRFLIGLFIILLFASFYQIRIRRIKSQKRNLEVIVQQRTKELIEKHEQMQAQANELRHNNEKLLELGEFKEMLMNGIVHDLKNPLNVLLNVSEGFIDEGKRKTIQQTSLGMLNMVLNILDVQKFEETAVKLDIERIDIGTIIGEAKSQVEFLLKEKFLTLHTYIPKDVWIEVDIALAIRVLVNLLTNAIKHSTSNSKIEVFVEKHSSQKYIKILVRDEGKGMKPEQTKEIFKKFTQFENNSQNKIRSTGLGLTFCKMAIEAHNGTIEVSSIPDKETIFSFTLPLSIDSELNEKSKDLEEKITDLKVLANMTDTEKQLFENYIEDLQSKEVYEISDIQDILSNIDFTQSKNLTLWYKNMENALYACNDEIYRDLISILH